MSVAVEYRRPGRYHVAISEDGSGVENAAEVAVLGPDERCLTLNGRKHHVRVSEQGATIDLEIDGVAHTVLRGGGTPVRTPQPALVTELHVSPGDPVSAGQTLATLESTRMLSTVVSPHDGVVASTAVLPNTQVERGATLVLVRPEDVDEGAFAGASATVPPPATTVSAGPTADSESDLVEVYGRLRSYLLGYDLGPDAFSATLAEQKAFTAGVEAEDARLLAAEDALIDLYVEIASLYRPCTEADIWHEGDADGGEVADTQEYVLAFLQWKDADRAGLPPAYRERLARALSCYDVENLDAGACPASSSWQDFLVLKVGGVRVG